MYKGALQNINHNKGENNMLIADLLCGQLVGIYRSKAREKGESWKDFHGVYKETVRVCSDLDNFIVLLQWKCFCAVNLPRQADKITF